MDGECLTPQTEGPTKQAEEGLKLLRSTNVCFPSKKQCELIMCHFGGSTKSTNILEHLMTSKKINGYTYIGPTSFFTPYLCESGWGVMELPQKGVSGLDLIQLGMESVVK